MKHEHDLYYKELQHKELFNTGILQNKTRIHCPSQCMRISNGYYSHIMKVCIFPM